MTYGKKASEGGKVKEDPKSQKEKESEDSSE
jgi:hypothetical protein